MLRSDTTKIKRLVVTPPRSHGRGGWRQTRKHSTHTALDVLPPLPPSKADRYASTVNGGKKVETENRETKLLVSLSQNSFGLVW